MSAATNAAASTSAVSDSLYRKRRLINGFNLIASGLCAAFGLFWLVWILWTTLMHGIAAMKPGLFTQMTPPPGSDGGIANALFGSLLMSVIAILIGTPIGVAAGTYLAEFAKKKAIGEVIRFVNDILLSAPSIVLGLFVYTLVVRQTGHFSGWAGSLALALIVLPVVVRTTDEMLQLVPSQMREAALSLGVARHHDRHPARSRAHQRRNRAAAVHRAQQPVLDGRPRQADGERSGGRLPVCDESVRILAEPRLGRRVRRDRFRAAPQHPFPCDPAAQQGKP